MIIPWKVSVLCRQMLRRSCRMGFSSPAPAGTALGGLVSRPEYTACTCITIRSSSVSMLVIVVRFGMTSLWLGCRYEGVGRGMTVAINVRVTLVAKMPSGQSFDAQSAASHAMAGAAAGSAHSLLKR